jgi:hypothetical protein
MADNSVALTYEEIATAKAAIRVIRALGLVAISALVPLAVVLATPVMGWVLLAAILGSPLIFASAVVAAARHDVRGRRPA